MKRIQHREQFEIIVDTCASGAKVINGIDKLIGHLKNGHRVFEDYCITVPIQLGTEGKQCLFPEFLDARLRRKKGHLEDFYQKHCDHFKIVETDTSRAFKMAYCFEALPFLSKPKIRENVLEAAQELVDKLGKPHHHTLQLNEAMLDRFISEMAEQKQVFEEKFSKKEADIRRFHHSLSGRSDAALEALIKTTHRIKLGRAGKAFFAQMPEEYRYFMQAMYSERKLNKFVSASSEFKRFRFNQGERAIEDFLFDKRSESNPDRVTVIISEDQGARVSITNLRDRTANSIFCISAYGLGKALSKLELIDDWSALYSPRQLATTFARHEKRRGNRHPDTALTMNQVLDPEIEEKWAERLVEMVNWGNWRGPHQRHSGQGR